MSSKPVSVAKKSKRLNIIDLKNNYPEDFGRFIMALTNLQESDDWYRICGIHGATFRPDDPLVACSTDPTVVAVLSETGEPMYCKHKVYSFIAWHVPYVYQFELLLNMYNQSKCKDYIALPWLDLTDFSVDFSFINEPTIVIKYDDKRVIVKNPLASAFFYKDGVKTPITREGYLTPTTESQKTQLNTVKKELNNVLYAKTYETFSSYPVGYTKTGLISDYIALETPHNTIHDVIGGEDGNMAYVNISAFDPLFWLHHCNMDRHFYTWLYNNTDRFNCSIYPEKITQEDYEATQAPFFGSGTNIYSNDFNNYRYGWQNKEIKYMMLKDTIELEKFPYTYDIITPGPFVPVTSFVELIDVPIPIESISIGVYIWEKDLMINKDNNLAGSTSWFGLNRKKINCSRCKITRSNFKIDITEYLERYNITKDNIDQYNVLIEGKGKLILGEKGYTLYSLGELVGDGSYKIIVS